MAGQPLDAVAKQLTLVVARDRRVGAVRTILRTALSVLIPPRQQRLGRLRAHPLHRFHRLLKGSILTSRLGLPFRDAKVGLDDDSVYAALSGVGNCPLAIDLHAQPLDLPRALGPALLLSGDSLRSAFRT